MEQSKEPIKPLKLVPSEEDPMRDLTLEDLENEDIWSTYLSHHQAEVSLSEETHFAPFWTLYWPHGFMQAISGKYSKKWAELWACIFIRSWRYDKMGCESAEEKAKEIVYAKIKNDPVEKDFFS